LNFVVTMYIRLNIDFKLTSEAKKDT
jgi:hypothetical protein